MYSRVGQSMNIGYTTGETPNTLNDSRPKHRIQHEQQVADITQNYKPHRQRLTDPRGEMNSNVQNVCIQLVTDLLWNDIVDFVLSIVDLGYIIEFI